VSQTLLVTWLRHVQVCVCACVCVCGGGGVCVDNLMGVTEHGGTRVMTVVMPSLHCTGAAIGSLRRLNSYFYNCAITISGRSKAGELAGVPGKERDEGAVCFPQRCMECGNVLHGCAAWMWQCAAWMCCMDVAMCCMECGNVLHGCAAWMWQCAAWNVAICFL